MDGLCCKNVGLFFINSTITMRATKFIYLFQIISIKAIEVQDVPK